MGRVQGVFPYPLGSLSTKPLKYNTFYRFVPYKEPNQLLITSLMLTFIVHLGNLVPRCYC